MTITILQIRCNHANVVDLSSNSRSLLVRSWLLLHTRPSMCTKFGVCLEIVVWSFEQRTFYIGSLRVKFILTSPEAKWVALSSNSNTTSKHAPQEEIIFDFAHKTTNCKSESLLSDNESQQKLVPLQVF
jgi:hypothetical protein